MADLTPEGKKRLKFQLGITAAIITGTFTIIAALISAGAFTRKAEANNTRYNADCLQQNERITALEVELDESIKIAALCDISNEYFVRGADETAVKNSLQKLVRYAQQYKEDREHYTYKMFRLKKVMLNLPRRNINLRVDGGDPETYMLIQELLKGIEFFQGPVDGDRMNTYFAVKKFQENINTYTPGYFSPDNYGIFGNATLTAVMQIYERE